MVIDSIVLCRYLAKERFKDHQDELLFIDPSAMFMINFSDGRACSPCVRTTSNVAHGRNVQT